MQIAWIDKAISSPALSASRAWKTDHRPCSRASRSDRTGL